MLLILQNKIPKESISLISQWINELNIKLKFVNKRVTKLGDFRYDTKNGFAITINNNLNQYSSLITLTHEIAHAFVFSKYGNNVKPHGKEWKSIFKKLIINFLNPNIFPNDILSPLSSYMINPSASTSNNLDLVMSLRNYDSQVKPTVSQIHIGERFLYSNKVFVKEALLRKRIKCREIDKNKYYLFNPLTEIKIIE